MVLLDMSKAFDSISHEILLLKLKDVGASNTCLQWFNSYLSDWQQVVRINSTLSESLSLRSGVPQGSILSSMGVSKRSSRITREVQINEGSAALMHFPRRWSWDLHAVDGIRRQKV